MANRHRAQYKNVSNGRGRDGYGGRERREGRFPLEAGGNPNVLKEAKEGNNVSGRTRTVHFRTGGKVKALKTGGKVPGSKSGGRLDKFARGGRAGADKNPFSSAKRD